MAVYTKVSSDQAVQFLRDYDIGQLRELTGIQQGIDNSNYHLVTTRGAYILTLYEKRIRPEDLPFYIGLMQHLAAHDVPCPQPIQARDGVVLRALNGRMASIVTYLEGEATEHVTLHHCTKVGDALAKLHRAGQNCTLFLENNLGLEGWINSFHASADRADEAKAGLKQILQTELEWLKTNWPSDLPKGLIHADLFRDNVFFADDHVSGIFDFYFACTDFLAYDLAITLNAWCFEQDGAFNFTKARALIQGYDSERALSPEEKAAFPILLRGAAMRFLVTRLFDWLNPVVGALANKPKDPLEYLARLQFHQQASGLYGFENDIL